MLIRNKFAVYNQDFIEWRELRKTHIGIRYTFKQRKPLNNGNATDQI